MWLFRRKGEKAPNSRPRPLVWCEVGRHMVRGYKEGGAPIPHLPCRLADSEQETRQLPTIPPPEEPADDA